VETVYPQRQVLKQRGRLCNERRPLILRGMFRGQARIIKGQGDRRNVVDRYELACIEGKLLEYYIKRDGYYEPAKYFFQIVP